MKGARVVHGGTGRAYKSIEEMVSDPACPMGPTRESWAEAALSVDEVQGIYKMVATLAYKVTRVAPGSRKEAASACWHAIQCIRNVFARLGDVVTTAAIERDRFVVLEMKESEGLRATGRIVVAPSGAYAYSLRRLKVEKLGDGLMDVGMMFFPMGSEIEVFESFGWRAKGGSGTHDGDGTAKEGVEPAER